MNNDQKMLLIGGGVILVLSIIYIMGAGVPNDPVSAMLFPLSILGMFFGVGFIIWALAWMGLQRANFLK